MGIKEFMHWLPIDMLGDYKAFPSFYSENLRKIKDRVEHIVTYAY